MLGEYRLDGLKSSMLQDFVNDLAKKYSIKICREALMLVKNIIHFAERNEVIPIKKYNVKLPKDVKKKKVVLNGEEYKKLYDYCLGELEKKNSNKSALGVIIAMETGMRIGEICGLRWDDVDFDKHTISVERTVLRTYSYETGKTALVINDPKTPKSKRKVPITNNLCEILEKYKSIGYICTGKEDVPTEPRTLRSYYTKRRDRLELPKVNFHGLRHGFATRAIAKNIDPRTVAEILGHEKCDITLDIYTSCTDEMMAEAVEKLNG
jgi:integrase